MWGSGLVSGEDSIFGLSPLKRRSERRDELLQLVEVDGGWVCWRGMTEKWNEGNDEKTENVKS